MACDLETLKAKKVLSEIVAAAYNPRTRVENSVGRLNLLLSGLADVREFSKTFAAATDPRNAKNPDAPLMLSDLRGFDITTIPPDKLAAAAQDIQKNIADVSRQRLPNREVQEIFNVQARMLGIQTGETRHLGSDAARSFHGAQVSDMVAGHSAKANCR